MNMYGLAFTQKAAGLYGLKSSAQGSGRKRFIIVRSTNRTQLLESAGQKRLRDMLAAHEDSLDVLKPGTQAALAYRGKYQKLDSLHPSSVRCTQLDSCGKPLTAPEGGLDLLRPGSQTTACQKGGGARSLLHPTTHALHEALIPDQATSSDRKVCP